MKRLLLIVSILAAGSAAGQKVYEVSAPDGGLVARVTVGKAVMWSMEADGEVVMAPSTVAMITQGVPSIGFSPRVKSTHRRSVDETFATPIYKRSQVRDRFNELRIGFWDGYDIVFRAWDDAVAWRWEYTARRSFEVVGEQADWTFAAESEAVFAYVKDAAKPFATSFENYYTHAQLKDWQAGTPAYLPLVVRAGNRRVLITEADLMNYPGMYLAANGATLSAMHAPVPRTLAQGGHNNLQMEVTATEDYIARVEGPTVFPWRVAVVAASDAELLDSDAVYRLGTAPQGDFSWVRPGKVAWDWWNDWNLWGVDFEAGINMATYKYYIDFAARSGIEYVILDEGWAVNGEANLMAVVPEIDVAELVKYATEKGVGIILWAGYRAFDRDMEEVCAHYSAMGVKGFKVDFMDRDDQPMVEFHRRAAQVTAKYKLLIDFHGTYKPTGLQRTWPNVINFEGVNGLEQLKWTADADQVGYEVTIPFIRQAAGPMDYTQGAMRNATRDSFRAVHSEAMSQGTRTRQLAQYVVFEAPLTMLCDSPSAYLREEECLRFIADVPTVWDETVVIGGEMGRWAAIARRRGDTWWVGAMTDWSARTETIDLSFLGGGTWRAEIFEDGPNAARAARDYRRRVADVPQHRRMTVTLAPGGGWAAKIINNL